MDKLLYKIKIVDQTMTQVFEQGLGISLTRYEILQVLLKEAPCSQVDLQEALQIDQAAITRQLKILETAGYIKRQRNPKNQRQMLVTVTDKARHYLVLNPPAHHLRVKGDLETILTKQEQSQLDSLLTKLQQGLEDLNTTHL